MTCVHCRVILKHCVHSSNCLSCDVARKPQPRLPGAGNLGVVTPVLSLAAAIRDCRLLFFAMPGLDTSPVSTSRLSRRKPGYKEILTKSPQRPQKSEYAVNMGKVRVTEVRTLKSDRSSTITLALELHGTRLVPCHQPHLRMLPLCSWL